MFCWNIFSSHSGHQKMMPCRSSWIKLIKLSMSPVQTPLIDPFYRSGTESPDKCAGVPQSRLQTCSTPYHHPGALHGRNQESLWGPSWKGGNTQGLCLLPPLLKSDPRKSWCAPESNYMCMVV